MKTNDKKFKQLGKYFHVLVLVQALWVTSIPLPVIAQSTPPADTSSGTRAIMGALDGFGNSFMQMASQFGAQQRAAAMMQALTPRIIPARFFPQCRLPQADSNFPANACSNVQDPTTLQLADALVGLATNYDQFYTQMLSEAQNTPFPAGVQCLEESRKQVDSQINDKINSLTAIISRIKKESQAFRDANRSLTEDMRNIKEELDGGSSRTLDSKNAKTNIRDQFKDPACNEVLSDELLATANGGLRNVRELFNNPQEGGQGLRTAAGNLQRDVPVLKQHLDTQMERMRADINSIGIEDWVGQSSGRLNTIRRGGLTAFKGMDQAMGDEITNFNTELNRIKSELQQVVGGDFSIPKMDRHFQENIQGFSNGAKQFFRKRFINSCVDGSNKTGVTLSTEQILSGLRMNNNEAGTTLNDFKIALTNILATDAFIQDKMAQIRALEQQYGGQITVEFVDAGARVTRQSPFELYKTQISSCEQLFEQDQTFSGTGGGMGLSALSQKDKIDRAERYLQDAKKLEQSFIERLTGTIKDKILNCGDNSNTRAGQCNMKAMDSGDENFCINTAVRCSSNIQACYAKIETKVKEKEGQLKAKADVYNRNIRGLIARQEQVLNGLKRQVLQDQEFLKRFFPGANYTFPGDVFVDMPKMEDSEFGLQLVGGKDLDLNFLMETLPGKLETMKQSLAEQRSKVNEEINRYKEQQKAAMQKNKQDWAQLKTTCESAARTMRQNVAQQNQQGAQRQQEQDQKVAEFCGKYDALRHSNPGPGCEGDFSPRSLHSEAIRISTLLDASVTANLNEYNNLCARVNNESNSTSTTGSGSGDAFPLRTACGEGSWNSAFTTLSNTLLSNMPSTATAHREGILNFLRTGEGNLSDMGVSGGFRTAVERMRALRSSTISASASSSSSSTGGGTASGDANSGTARDPEIERIRRGMNNVKEKLTGLPSSPNAGELGSGVAGCINTLNPGTHTDIFTSQNAALNAMAPSNPLNDTNLAERVETARSAMAGQGPSITAYKACLEGLPRNAAPYGTATAPCDVSQGADIGSLNAKCRELRGKLLDAGLMATGMETLNRELPLLKSRVAARTTPAAAPVASSPTSTTDVCEAIDVGVQNTVTSECGTRPASVASEISAFNTCKTGVETRLASRLPSSPARLNAINSELMEIFEQGRTSNVGNTAQLWSRIGERSSGACAAAGNSSRPGNAFAEFLQRFDSATIGSGPGSTLR